MKFSLRLQDGLKAHEILAEDACIRAVEEARKYEGKLGIPVTMKGILVGHGEVLRDGTITVTTEKGPEGLALRQMLLDGSANCISIGPNPKGPIVRNHHEGA